MSFANLTHKASRLMLLPLAAAVGCDSTPANPVAPGAPAQSPEEMFDAIISALKRHIEDESLGTAAAVADYNGPVGAPIASGKVSVESELTPPEADGQPYRATIGLVTKSKVTVVLSPPSKEEVDGEKDKRQAEIDRLEEELEGVPDLDALVAPVTEGSAAKVSGPTVHEIEPEDAKRVYELEFRDGRWELLTQLDPENEPFYALAIEYAMKRQ